MPIGRPLRIDVQAALIRQHGERTLLEIEQCDAPLRKAQIREAAGVAAVTRKRDHLPVRRPLRLEIPVAIVREALEMTRGDVDGIEVGEATVASAEYDELAVRGPARTGDALERQIEALRLLA